MAINQREWTDILAAQSFVADRSWFMKSATLWGNLVSNSPGHLKMNCLRHAQADIDQAIAILTEASARVAEEMAAITKEGKGLAPHLTAPPPPPVRSRHEGEPPIRR